VLLSAPAPGLWSWAQLNPIGSILLPFAAWLAAFAAVMLVTERVVIRWLDYLERVAAIYARGRFSVRPVQAANAPSEIRLLAQTLDELAENITTRDGMLTESLSEKDALMREIHHRVKNNLQIISSLLSMQQRALTDAPAKAALGDTRQRISALALIYRTLYQSENIRYADAREFLTELVGQLIAAEAMRGPVVSSSIEADSLVVDPDKLAPLALWLVEAVSNAQKHAFAGRGGDLQGPLQGRWRQERAGGSGRRPGSRSGGGHRRGRPHPDGGLRQTAEGRGRDPARARRRHDRPHGLRHARGRRAQRSRRSGRNRQVDVALIVHTRRDDRAAPPGVSPCARCSFCSPPPPP
jgi:two-component sensor histidine kinase